MSDIPILHKVKEPDSQNVEKVLTEMPQFMSSLTKSLEENTAKIEENTKAFYNNSIKKTESQSLIPDTTNFMKPLIKTLNNNTKIANKTNKDIATGFKEGLANKAKELQAVAGKAVDFAKESFVGDISFLTKPLSQLGDISKGIMGIFKPKRRPPKRSAMLKTNPEAVYMVDALLKGDKKSSLLEKFKGLLPMLMGAGGIASLAKMFGSMLMKAGAIGLLAGGLIWMAVDGIKGFFKAKSWGVSKVAAVIGGALAGTGSGGWSQAFTNMGKGAAVGAGAGFLIGGPIGALVGGFIGGAIGGILGYFGGQKTAVEVDKILGWLMNNPAVLGAGIGALAGLAIFGPVGMIAGALLGASIGALIGDITKNKKLDMATVMGLAMKDPRVSALAGAAMGGMAGFAIAGPVGFLAGALLGAALGGLAGSILGDKLIKKQVNKAISSKDTSTLDTMVSSIDDLTDMRSKLFEGLSKEDQKYLEKRYKSRFAKSKAINEKGDTQRQTTAINSFTQIKGGSIPATGNLPPNWIKQGTGWYNTSSLEYTNTKPISHQDVIMRPDGSVHETSPQDTIIATKNPIAFADKELSSSLSAMNKPTSNEIDNLIVLIKQLLSKKEPTNQNNILTNNYTSRYNPLSIMNNLTAEVF